MDGDGTSSVDEDVLQWLAALKLEDYLPNFSQHRIRSKAQVMALTEKDLVRFMVICTRKKPALYTGTAVCLIDPCG